MITVIDIVGVAIAVVLFAMLWSRPSGLVAIGLALALVVTGIAVSWQSVEAQRREQASAAAFQQRQPAAQTVGAPPPDHPRAGS